MHFMPNNDLEGNMSHFILIASTKKNIMLPKTAFQILAGLLVRLNLLKVEAVEKGFGACGQRG